MKPLALLILVAALFAVTLAQSKSEYSTLDKCLALSNDCEACAAEKDCGFCGSFGVGYCVPGSKSSSDVTKFGTKEECPADYWTYEAASCGADELRIISKTETTNTATFTSIGVSGTLLDANVDFVTIAVSTVLRPTITVGFGQADTDEANLKFYAIGFDNMIEYENKDKKGLTDVASIKQTVPITNFKNIDTGKTTEEGVEVHTITATTTDDKFSLICKIANGVFTYENQIHTPYETKCDVYVKDFGFTGDDNNLAINAWVVSAEVDVDGTEVETSAKFGDGGYFKWVNYYSEAEDSAKVGDVITTDIDLIGEDTPTDGEFITTVYSFVGKQGDIFWDPTLGVSPVDAATGNEFSTLKASRNSAASMGLSLVVLALAFLMF